MSRLNSAVRWLLQVDRPVVWRSEAEVAAEVERNYRWNFTVNMLDGASFWFGVSFISSTTIVPLFVSKLTANPLAIGMAAVIAQSSWFLPQLFTANWVERLARKKPVVVNVGLISERLPMWLIVASALIAARAPQLALVLFLSGYAWHGLGAGMVATAWQDLLARCFPVDRRGRFFGTTMFVGAGSGAAAATFSAWLLKTFPFPTNFVYAFTIAALGITISWFFIALTREPVQWVAAPRRSHRQFWGDLVQIVRRDDNFRHFLWGRALLALGGMGVGFVTVAAVQRWDVPDSTVGLYTLTYLLGQTAGNLIFGLLADKFGHKLSLELSALASLLAFALAWLAPAPEWFFAVFALLGVNLGAVIVSGILVVLEFCPPEKRPTYIGLANTAVGVVSAGAPLIGAGLATASYEWLFALSMSTNFVALVVMRWWVREPRLVDREKWIVGGEKWVVDSGVSEEANGGVGKKRKCL
jgi:MFS family permease